MSKQPASTTAPARVDIRTHVQNTMQQALRDAGKDTGLIAEIGGPHNSFYRDVSDYEFEFLSLYGVADNPQVRVADITDCPQIESERYDAVVSISVFEHVERPWKAAKEIERILKPGGLAVHLAPFSYFYHKAPEDYWRYTPAGFAAIFDGLEVVHEEFYGANRRRDNQGSATNPVDRDGGPQFALDELGGWRENWHTLFVARKPADGGVELLTHRRNQLVLDLMKVQLETGVPEDDAAARIVDVMAPRAEFASLPGLTRDAVSRIWLKRPGAVKVSAYRWSRAAAILR